MIGNNNPHIPFYIRCSQILIGVIAFFYIVYIGRDILAPLVFSMLLAILLNPLVNFLHRHKLNRVIAILLALLSMLCVLSAVVFFLGSQIGQFRDSLPDLKIRFAELFDHFVQWLSRNFGFDPKDINDWFGQMEEQGLQDPSSIGSTVNTISGFLLSFLLVPVYVFLLLFYKPLLLDFVRQIFPSKEQNSVSEVLDKTKGLVQSYMIGLMIEACIVATMDSVGLLLIGIEHAVLFGVLAAVLNLIPYIGGFIATSLPVAMALTSDTPNDAFLVVGLFAFVQLVDNNLLIPTIVASKVKINALVSIIVVIIGGALWSVPGMFLALPTTAIVKVICDAAEPLKPIGFLLGDNMPPVGKIILRRPNKVKGA